MNARTIIEAEDPKNFMRSQVRLVFKHGTGFTRVYADAPGKQRFLLGAIGQHADGRWFILSLPEDADFNLPPYDQNFFATQEDAGKWYLRAWKLTESEDPKSVFRQAVKPPAPPRYLLQKAVGAKEARLGKKFFRGPFIHTNPQGETFAYCSFGNRRNHVVSTLLFYDTSYRMWKPVDEGTFAEAEDPKNILRQAGAQQVQAAGEDEKLRLRSLIAERAVTKSIVFLYEGALYMDIKIGPIRGSHFGPFTQRQIDEIHTWPEFQDTERSDLRPRAESAEDPKKYALAQRDKREKGAGATQIHGLDQHDVAHYTTLWHVADAAEAEANLRNNLAKANSPYTVKAIVKHYPVAEAEDPKGVFKQVAKGKWIIHYTNPYGEMRSVTVVGVTKEDAFKDFHNSPFKHCKIVSIDAARKVLGEAEDPKKFLKQTLAWAAVPEPPPAIYAIKIFHGGKEIAHVLGANFKNDKQSCAELTDYLNWLAQKMPYVPNENEWITKAWLRPADKAEMFRKYSIETGKPGFNAAGRTGVAKVYKHDSPDWMGMVQDSKQPVTEAEDPKKFIKSQPHLTWKAILIGPGVLTFQCEQNGDYKFRLSDMAGSHYEVSCFKGQSYERALWIKSHVFALPTSDHNEAAVQAKAFADEQVWPFLQEAEDPKAVLKGMPHNSWTWDLADRAVEAGEYAGWTKLSLKHNGVEIDSHMIGPTEPAGYAKELGDFWVDWYQKLDKVVPYNPPEWKKFLDWYSKAYGIYQKKATGESMTEAEGPKDVFGSLPRGIELHITKVNDVEVKMRVKAYFADDMVEIGGGDVPAMRLPGIWISEASIADAFRAYNQSNERQVSVQSEHLADSISDAINAGGFTQQVGDLIDDPLEDDFVSVDWQLVAPPEIIHYLEHVREYTHEQVAELGRKHSHVPIQHLRRFGGALDDNGPGE